MNRIEGSDERQPDSVAKVTLASLERGEMTTYLSPGDSIKLPADRVEVEALEVNDA